MTLGSKLRSYVPEDVEQKMIAMDWLGAIEAAGLKKLSPTTATSRLSELFADDPQGVRTFFRDARRAKALFEVLKVPEDARAELIELAQPVLNGGPRPRLVVDVSDLGNERAVMDVVFAGLREQVLGEGAVFPVALVLTDVQYDLLPRSFDRFQDRLQLERVPDGEAGAEAAQQLAGDDVVLLSRRPIVPLNRWWALSAGKSALVLEPADGLDHVRGSGALPVPQVSHPLEHTPGTIAEVPAGGAERRRLIAALADENSAESQHAPVWRAAAAVALGVQATSTERERIEQEIAAAVAALGTEVAERTDAEWTEATARASRRPVSDIVMRVDDTIRVLNPTGPVPETPRVQVVRVECAEPHLVTLERVLDEWTEDDLVQDPLLFRLIGKLAAGDRRAVQLLLHARAVLVYGGRVPMRRGPAVTDPLGALRTLLAGEVPEAELRVRTTGETAKLMEVTLGPVSYPDARIEVGEAKPSALLRHGPPVGDVLWQRGSKLLTATPKVSRADYTHRWADAGRPAALIRPGADAAEWLDDVEASPMFGGDGSIWSRDTHLPEHAFTLDWHDVEVPEDLWSDADVNLGMAWLAVRDSIGGRSLRLPDGSVLIQVGGGLAAHVHVREHGAADARVRAALRCVVEREYRHGAWMYKLNGPLTPATTHVARTGTRVSVMVPSVWLAGKGFAADVRFVPAAMLPGAPSLGSDAGGAIGGVVAAIDTEHD